jgi:hypothetical protein
MLKFNLLFFCLLLFVFGLQAQVSMVKNGKALSRIILSSPNQAETQAAELLQNFINKISGVKLPILNEQPKKDDIIIGNGQSLPASLKPLQKKLTEDGFLLSTSDGYLRIVSGGDKGAIYGVVTLLEQQLGVSYWSEMEYSLKPRTDIDLPSFQLVDNPAFRYRQIANYATKDSIFKMWYRLEEPKEVFAGGLWVHTFDKILPSSQYGVSHPEYYAWFNGQRHPGKASQWCLTNPELFEIAAHRIDSIFKANPDRKMISVSQNDGNFTWCTCPACKALDDLEGSHSGSIIHFLNKLAARFPDKEFSTLAYLYTMNPPKHVIPLPNVNIMLCDIDCKREVSLTENESGRAFTKALEGWSAITNNLFVWDYGINFDNYLSPFPNFHILQDNIRLFKKHHTTMHYSQINGTKGGDFAELRTYMVAKLMWNPEVNCDSVMHTFLDGYYGAAGPYLYRYIHIMEGALIASGVPLWIYDTPVSHKKGMLKPELMTRYNALFDEAEKAVSKDDLLLTRVRRTRLSLQYSDLEILRTETEKDLIQVGKKLDLFEQRAKEFGITMLNERANSPLDYCKLYRERSMANDTQNKALGGKITYTDEPSGKYKDMSDKTLTDGLYGGATYGDSWVGWEGKDASFILDLGEKKNFDKVETDFLHQIGAWILAPLQVDYFVSSDGVTYSHWGTCPLGEDQSTQVKFVKAAFKSPQPVDARYIKVAVVGTKVCPQWHYGVGNPSWFFVDEVKVY